MGKKVLNAKFFNHVVELLHAAKTNVARIVNSTMAHTYYEIGRMIVEEEQDRKGRAEYGKSLLQEWSGILTKEFGKGFSVTNLQQMRSFFITYQKQQTVSVKSGQSIQRTVHVESSIERNHIRMSKG